MFRLKLTQAPKETDCAAAGSSVLPPYGQIIRVSDWRRRLLWFCAVGFGFLGISVIISAAQLGRPLALFPALVALAVIVVSARLPICGVILEQWGVKGRNIWRTYRWQWGEIERFELRDRRDSPRFRIRLCDGRIKGFPGFFAQTPAEEARAKELFQALQDRLCAAKDDS
jgi:hypothetical protein